MGTAPSANRGLSKVVGIALLLVVVVLLVVTTAVMVFGMADIEDPATVAPVAFEEGIYDLEVEVQAHMGQVDQLEVVHEGDTVETWAEYGTGSTTTVECVDTGDDISVVSVDDGQRQVVQDYEVQRPTACSFQVSQPGTDPFRVAPVNWQHGGDRAKEFYSYGGKGPDGTTASGDGTCHPHAHMPPSSPYVDTDVSYIFFYEYNDEMSLVIVHDKPNEHRTRSKFGCDPTDHQILDHISGAVYEPSQTTVGGAAKFTFTGLPGGGSWVIQDDDHDFDSDTDEDVCWSWNDMNTDGGVFSGGFSDPDSVDLEIDVTWETVPCDGVQNSGHQVDEWMFIYLADDGIQKQTLAKDETLTIDGIED